MLYIYAVIALSFYPFPIIPGINLSLPDVAAFLGFFHLLLTNFGGIVDGARSKIFYPYAFCVVFSVAASNLINIQDGVGLSPVFKYLLYCIVFPVMLLAAMPNDLKSCDYDDFISRFIKINCVSGLIFCIVLITLILSDQVGFDEFGNYYIYQYHKNAAGALLYFSAALGVISIVFYRYRLGYFAVLLSLILLVLTGSRAYFFASLGFLISCAIVGASEFNRMIKRVTSLVALVAIFIALGWIFFPELFSAQAARFNELLISSDQEINSANSRFVLWRLAFNDFLLNPLFGVGYGGFQPDLGGFFEGIIEPHNAILQIAGQGGSIGILAFTILLILAYRRVSNKSSPIIGRYIRNALIFYIIANMFGIIWVRGDGHIFWMLLWFSVFLADRSHQDTEGCLIKN